MNPLADAIRERTVFDGNWARIEVAETLRWTYLQHVQEAHGLTRLKIKSLVRGAPIIEIDADTTKYVDCRSLLLADLDIEGCGDETGVISLRSLGKAGIYAPRLEGITARNTGGPVVKLHGNVFEANVRSVIGQGVERWIQLENPSNDPASPVVSSVMIWGGWARECAEAALWTTAPSKYGPFDCRVWGANFINCHKGAVRAINGLMLLSGCHAEGCGRDASGVAFRIDNLAFVDRCTFAPGAWQKIGLQSYNGGPNEIRLTAPFASGMDWTFETVPGSTGKFLCDGVSPTKVKANGCTVAYR